MTSIKFVSVLLFVILVSVQCQLRKPDAVALVEVTTGQNGNSGWHFPQLGNLGRKPKSQVTPAEIIKFLQSIGVPQGNISKVQNEHEGLLNAISKLLSNLLSTIDKSL